MNRRAYDDKFMIISDNVCKIMEFLLKRKELYESILDKERYSLSDDDFTDSDDDFTDSDDEFKDSDYEYKELDDYLVEAGKRHFPEELRELNRLTKYLNKTKIEKIVITIDPSKRIKVDEFKHYAQHYEDTN